MATEQGFAAGSLLSLRFWIRPFDRGRPLRDAARPLTEVRDAKILVETTDKLRDEFQQRVAGRTFTAVRDRLMAQAREVRKRVLAREHAFSSVRKALRAVQPHVKQWTDVRDEWSSIGKQLREKGMVK